MSVYTGVWYNHASEKLVLTLGFTAGGFLSAAIVLWVHLVATATWPIFRYVLYFIRSRAQSDQDVFHFQRQVMLRNSRSAAMALGQLLQLVFRWRSTRPTYKNRRLLSRTLPYMFICTLIFLLWLVCGLYAPYIYTRTGPDVLLANSSHCGFVGGEADQYEGTDELALLLQRQSVTFVQSGQAYAQQCYQNSSTDFAASLCNSYAQPSINYTTTTATCPFGSDGSVCQTVNSSVVQFDTGPLDSSLDLGINTPKDESLKYRRITTCAPIHTSGFASIFNVSGTPLESEYIPGTTFVQFYYGPYLGNNYTYEYPVLQLHFSIPYTLETYFHSPGLPPLLGIWAPNATLFNRTDADLSLFLLAGNSVLYPAPVYDPFFSAGIFPEDEIVIPATSGLPSEIGYESSFAINAMACTAQHQICFASDTEQCTPLVASLQLINATAKLPGLTLEQEATMARIALAQSDSTMAKAAMVIGASSLLASRSLYGLNQLAMLPTGQWILEAANWFSVSLALLQQSVHSYAAGPSDPRLFPYVIPPSTEAGARTCALQRTRNGQGYINFNLSALIGSIVGGAILMALGQTFTKLMGLLGKLRPTREKGESLADWKSDGLYQVHRVMLQTKGVKDWQNVDKDIPTSHHTVDGSLGDHQTSLLQTYTEIQKH